MFWFSLVTFVFVLPLLILFVDLFEVSVQLFLAEEHSRVAFAEEERLGQMLLQSVSPQRVFFCVFAWTQSAAEFFDQTI